MYVLVIFAVQGVVKGKNKGPYKVDQLSDDVERHPAPKSRDRVVDYLYVLNRLQPLLRPFLVEFSYNTEP